MEEINHKEKGKLLATRKKVSTKRIIRYIQKPGGTCVAWLKFIAVMLAAGLLLWQLVEKIQSYVENPVIVTREIGYLSEIPFPGLMVCNKQPLRNSYVRNSPMKPVIDHFVSSADGANRIEDKERLSYFSGRANEVDIKDFYMNASQAASDFIVDCNWRGGEMNNCSDADFKLVHTDYGPCYRLSLNESEWPNMTAAGIADAVQIVLNIDAADSYQTRTVKSIGALIALFLFDSRTPVVSHIGFTVPTGFEATIGIRSEYIERLSKRKKGQCDPDAKLVLFEKYTTAGCYMENRFMRVVNGCQCLPYNFPEYRNPDDEANTTEYLKRFPTCNVEKQYSCVDSVWGNTDSVDLKNFTCLDACESHRYSTAFTYATISGSRLREAIPDSKKENIQTNYAKAINARHNSQTRWNGSPHDDYYKENFVVVNIYFKELLHETIVQHLTYDGWGFIGDIAATVGIILGFLLSTLGEVVTSCIWVSRKVRGKPDKENEDDDEDDEEEDEDGQEESEEEDTKKDAAKKDKSKKEQRDYGGDHERNEDDDVRNRRNLSKNRV